LFSRSLSLSASSLVQYTPMLSKVYFPRIIAPASYVLGALFDFFLTSILLGLMMAWYGIPPARSLVLVPLVLLFTLMCSMGFGCILAAVDARYRDVRHALPLLIQVWMFCTPVMYPTSYIPEKWKLLYALNPTVGLTEAFRWLIFRLGPPPPTEVFALAGVTSVLVFVVGVVYFQKVQGTLVDSL
jgi:lipopolysaccharide transport system permease protein